MAILPILHYPDPRLQRKAEPVAAVDAELQRLAEDMAETMYAAPGVGLAATQVGVSRRLVVLDCAPKDQPGELIAAVNPEILEAEGELFEEEGCLSVPGYYAKVERRARVRIRYRDLQDRQIEGEFEGLWAVAFQHEIDHLDGVLFVDRLSSLKKSLFRKKYQKIMRQQEEQL